MNSKIIIALTMLAAMVLSGCRSNQSAPKTYAVTGADIYCLANPGDGTLTLKSWGTGANRAEAVESAIRNAVRQVLFSGVKTGPGAAQTSVLPLVNEVNAQERYAYYFEPFFGDGGLYLVYGQEDTTNRKSRTETKSASRQGDGIVVKVNRTALKQRLISDGILKP